MSTVEHKGEHKGEHKAKVLSASGLREVTFPGSWPGLAAPEVEVTWVHCYPDAGVVQALDDMGLDEVGVRSLRDGPERPRVERQGRSPASSDPTDRPGTDGSQTLLQRLNELRLFLGPRWIISVGRLHEADYLELADTLQPAQAGGPAARRHATPRLARRPLCRACGRGVFPGCLTDAVPQSRGSS